MADDKLPEDAVVVREMFSQVPVMKPKPSEPEEFHGKNGIVVNGNQIRLNRQQSDEAGSVEKGEIIIAVMGVEDGDTFYAELVRLKVISRERIAVDGG